MASKLILPEGRFIGIDPGFRSCGYAEIKVEDGKIDLIRTLNLNPSTYKELPAFVNNLLPSSLLSSTKAITVERMVPFNGQATTEAEVINHLIGGFRMMAFQSQVPLYLTRSIDWKIKMVKFLVKTCGFSNPSVELDKKFSVAAAEAILHNFGKDKGKDETSAKSKKTITHHEADAICLACCAVFNLVE